MTNGGIMLSKAKLGLFVCVCGVAGSSALAAAAEDSDGARTGPPVTTPSAVVEAADDASLDEEALADFAKREGITVPEARRAFADSGAIGDFIAKWESDPRFGAAWVTYDGGYRIHVRYLDPTFATETATLSVAVGASVVTHTGGASASAMAEAEAYLEQKVVPYEVDPINGKIIVYRPTLAGDQILNSSTLDIREGEPPVVYGVNESHAGSDVWWWNGSSWGRRRGLHRGVDLGRVWHHWVSLSSALSRHHCSLLDLGRR